MKGHRDLLGCSFLTFLSSHLGAAAEERRSGGAETGGGAGRYRGGPGEYREPSHSIALSERVLHFSIDWFLAFLGVTQSRTSSLSSLYFIIYTALHSGGGLSPIMYGKWYIVRDSI
jgi:hypothetical protein